jgi:hypothetical protein
VRAVACHMICLLRRLCLLCQLLCSKEIKVAALMPAKACTVMSFLDGGMLRRQKRWVKVILCFVATGQLNVFDYSLQMKRIISVPVGKLILIFCCRCGTMHKNMLLYSIILCNTNILRLIVAHFVTTSYRLLRSVTVLCLVISAPRPERPLPRSKGAIDLLQGAYQREYVEFPSLCFSLSKGVR